MCLMVEILFLLNQTLEDTIVSTDLVDTQSYSKTLKNCTPNIFCNNVIDNNIVQIETA